MSKKRTSAESSNDEQTKEDDSGSIIQDADDAKRAKLAPLKDVTDLPIEVLEHILIKAVAMEVLELKVARCARKEQAELVIGRLGTVCSRWNCVLTTDIFRKKVHGLLEGQETIRFEILDQPSFQVNVSKLTTLKDEIFLLCRQHDRDPMVINIYDRNNMAEVKDVVRLVQIGLMWPIDMASCIVSNCVYVLSKHEYYCPSVYRMKRDEEHHWQLSPWLNNRGLSLTSRGPMSVASNGNLVILSGQESPSSKLYHVSLQVPRSAVFKARMACVSIFDANGSMQHKIMLSPDIHGFKVINSVIQKSDGNLVLLAANDENKVKLMEIDTTGRIFRQYQSSLHALNSVMSFAEVYGRILVIDCCNRIQLFDHFFNLDELADPQPPEGFLPIAPPIHFNNERNEIVRLEELKYTNSVFDKYRSIESSVLSIFRCTDE